MNRLVMMAVAAGAAMAAMAMPTRQQLAKAQEMVSDVTAADVKALKAGTKKPAEVAAKHMELAAQAGSEAEKYLLLQGAFHLYVKGEDYDNAAKAIETMQTEIKDFNPEVIVELCGKALVRKMQDNAPRLYAIKENARRIVFYRKQLPIREAAVRKNPKDPQAQRKLAECHVELGDWPKALGVFVKAGGEFKKMAEGETSGKVPAQELGDFWWDYETKSDTQVYKLHAAELYRKALADDSFKGLARTRTEQRVKEVEKISVDLPQVIAGGVAQTVETGLAHRWSFTKDFIDSVGKVEAKKRGQSVKIDNGRCVVQNGGVCLEDALLKVGVPSTLEMWYSPVLESTGSFILQSDQVAIRGEDGRFVLQWKEWAQKHSLVRFSPGHKLYFAITYDGQNITAYACDTDGDKKLYAASPVNEGYRYDRKSLYLGGTHPKSGKIQYPSSDKDNNGTSGKYDEVRIWRICKSKEDIEASIKAGPDQVVMPRVKRASTKNGTCEFKGVLPSIQYVLLWENISLKEINQLQGSLTGGFIPNNRVQSCYMKENGSRKTFQFQAIDDKHIKCVGVELVQRDGDVHGRIAYARYAKYASNDVDFDLNPGGKMDIAKTETDNGYAVKDLSIIDVKSSATVKKAIQKSGNWQAEKPTKKDESEKATGDDGWEWVIPMDIHDGWRMTMDEPHAKWLSADFIVPDDWKKILGRVDIGYGDRTHKRWLRTDVVWNGDVRKVEKAEIVSVVNDVAYVWIDGYEAAMHLRGGDRDITSVFKATIGKGRKVPVCVNIVDECGEGYLEFGIRVKMKK